MRNRIKQFRQFITFDFLLDTGYITSLFAGIHNKQQAVYPGWSTNATHRMVISSYWFKYVLFHFVILLGVPAFVLFLFQPQWNIYYLATVLLAGILTFIILFAFHYWPSYQANFLPRLETVKELYEKKQEEQLEKCRRAQLSNLALVLIFYVFNKTNKLDALQSSEQSANLLMKLYGVDPGSLKKNIELITGARRRLTSRKFTEIQNRFNEAFEFLEALGFKEGIPVLKALEAKFMKLEAQTT